MIHLIMIALFQSLILNNSNFTNVSSTTGLLQGINNGISQDEPVPGAVPNPLGAAMVVLVFVIAAGASSFKVDLPLAAAFGAMLATGTALILQTPGLALVGSDLPYIFGGLTVFFIFIALLAGGKSPFK